RSSRRLYEGSDHRWRWFPRLAPCRRVPRARRRGVHPRPRTDPQNPPLARASRAPLRPRQPLQRDDPRRAHRPGRPRLPPRRGRRRRALRRRPARSAERNINGTQNVLRLAFRHGKRLVFSSTSEVYGRNPRIPWREEDDRILGSTATDRWCYSTSKAVGEHFCFAFAKMGLPVTVLRYFNVYGPRLDAIDIGRVVTILLGQAQRAR